MHTEESHFSDSLHEFYMRKCIEIGLNARRLGESPVGSVIVMNDVIIAEGTEGSKSHNDITYHAEIEAIRNATNYLQSQDLSRCVLYTTHEPCIMCSYVIRHTKINTVVMALSSGEVGGVHSKHALLLDESIQKWGSAPKLLKGVLEKECKELLL